MCGCEIPFDEYLCNTCVNLFSSADKNVFIPYVDHFTAFAVYDSFGKEFAGRFKNDGDGYAISGAAYLIYKALVKGDSSVLNETDIITYVPMRFVTDIITAVKGDSPVPTAIIPNPKDTDI